MYYAAPKSQLGRINLPHSLTLPPPAAAKKHRRHTKTLYER